MAGATAFHFSRIFTYTCSQAAEAQPRRASATMKSNWFNQMLPKAATAAIKRTQSDRRSSAEADESVNTADAAAGEGLFGGLEFKTPSKVDEAPSSFSFLSSAEAPVAEADDAANVSAFGFLQATSSPTAASGAAEANGCAVCRACVMRILTPSLHRSFPARSDDWSAERPTAFAFLDPGPPLQPTSPPVAAVSAAPLPAPPSHEVSTPVIVQPAAVKKKKVRVWRLHAGLLTSVRRR